MLLVPTPAPLQQAGGDVLFASLLALCIWETRPCTATLPPLGCMRQAGQQ